jgi:hypothetical protein
MRAVTLLSENVMHSFQDDAISIEMSFVGTTAIDIPNVTC